MELIFLEWINQFWLDNETFILVTLLFIALDIISGVIKALITHTFSSTMMRSGFGHKLGIILALCAIAVIQVALFDPNFSLNFDVPLFDVACGLIIFMEFCSIVENCCVMNPQLDSIIGKYFDKSNDADTVNISNSYIEGYNQTKLFDDK